MVKCRYAPVAQLDRAQDSDSWCRRFDSCQVRHVGTDFAPFRFLFTQKISHTLRHSFFFAKKARLVCLFACKRAHNGTLSLPPFYESTFGASFDSKIVTSSQNANKPYNDAVCFSLYANYQKILTELFQYLIQFFI